MNTKGEFAKYEKEDHEIGEPARSYYLFLHPYVYSSVKKDKALLYNTLDGRILEYKNERIVKLIRKLNSGLNLYVIKLKENEIEENLKNFISTIRKDYIGDIIDARYRPNRPVQLKPMLKVQYAFGDIIVGTGKLKLPDKDELTDYLSVITLYINNSCRLSCPMCKTAHRQFLCCFKGPKNGEELNVNDITRFLGEIDHSQLTRINITGGNILQYSKRNELMKRLADVNAVKNYLIHYQNLVEEREFIEFLCMRNNFCNFLEIIVHFPLNRRRFEQCLDLLRNYKLNAKFRFIVEQEAHLEFSEELISDLHLESFFIFPHYNKANISFFEKNVFVNKNSLSESKPTMRDIFSRMILNKTDFRKITILSNNQIHANLNRPGIGKLGRDNIYDLIYRELSGGKTWTRVRKNVNPCKSCLYNCLCPPLSNYEYAIGRNNLCHIWQKGVGNRRPLTAEIPPGHLDWPDFACPECR